jgi:glyoxylase-like metal-dependent hydrolase (beta-lactamase superfamily II)
MSLFHPGKLENNVYLKYLGEDYIARSFELAHSVDSDLKLILNENLLSYTDKTAKAFLALVKQLKENKVPIHGVGIQSHIGSVRDTSIVELSNFIKSITDLGLEVEITELDARLKLFNGAEDPYEAQGKYYGRILKACLDNPLCKGLTFWGFSDNRSWEDSMSMFFPKPNEPYMFDGDLNPKPAYFYVFKALKDEYENCIAKESFKVLRQTTGPYQTNCYLIYSTDSKEAALIDPGWEVDTLTTFIKNNKLNLKYILTTHGHSDHYYLVPELKKEFPEVKWCLSKEDYEGIIKCSDWEIKAYGQQWVNDARKDPETRKYLDFDKNSAGVPDIFIEGNQSYKLGSVEIKTIHSPGHSPGGICYYTGNILFSGDMLFYRSVGIIDKQSSSKKSFIKSVRELYKMLPDSTVIFPGHYQYTTIGSEKKDNNDITIDGGRLEL